MPDIEVHTITNATMVRDTVRWLEARRQAVTVIEAPIHESYPEGVAGRVERHPVGFTAVLFRSADHLNESPRMAVVGNVLTCHEGQIHISLKKDLHS
jgi:hypothetical protein